MGRRSFCFSFHIDPVSWLSPVFFPLPFVAWSAFPVLINAVIFMAWQLYQEGKLIEPVDPKIGRIPGGGSHQVRKGSLFLHPSSSKQKAVDMLSRDIQLNEKQLTAPGFFQDSGEHSGIASPNKKSSESSTSYQMSWAPITVTEVTPR
ncbi:hypothetical protein F0562_014090 [Nyssa sinensis]|uniref:Uncharacterized protein n=1 Tax=Nyssa sinensis TaxID=561372 RepID=A0A5J4ZMD9_9ASTE|nr:hypothetical protein F0562_014090 [Nyssa sinensis]